MLKPDKTHLEREYQININQVGIINDDPLGETHQKFKTPNNIQFQPAINEDFSKEHNQLLEQKEKPQKRHGFQWPLHPYQILTFLLFGYNILMFYGVMIPSIIDYDSMERQALAGCLGAIYGLLMIFVIKYTYETTIIDPTDTTVYMERQAQLVGYDIVGFDVNQYEYFCNVCKTHVLEGTKHCQQCNRCVQKFDHHCPWLNNCIGCQNYKVFIKMLIWVTLAISYQEICGLVAFHYKENFQTYQKSGTKRIWISLVVNMCINAPTLLILMKLLSFHFFLMRENLTTYQYILKERERATNQKQQSKIILSVKNHQRGETPQPDSPRCSSDELEKQKVFTKDISERNQFINEGSPPIVIYISQSYQQSESSKGPSGDTLINTDDQIATKCSIISILKLKFFGTPLKSDILPRSIKVKPINQFSGGGSSSDCLPQIRSQSQLEQLSGMIDEDADHQLSKLPSQPSNKVSTSNYDKQNQILDLNSRQKTQLAEDEKPKAQRYQKKTAIVHNQQAENFTQNVVDSYRFSNKYEDILKADGLHLEAKTSEDVKYYQRRPPLQENANRSNLDLQRKIPLQQTPLIYENTISRLSADRPPFNQNANLKQVLNQQINNQTLDDAERLGSSQRKNSRNFLDRGNSEMLSITSKQSKRQPYDHKSLM